MLLDLFLAKLSLLPRIFSPIYDALFSTLPYWQRWRLLLLQPINIIVPILLSPFWLFSNRYRVLYIPTRSGPKRCLVYQPPGLGESRRREKHANLRPLHVDIHGGGFIGGIAEQNTRWCSYLSVSTGAAVVSLTYRIAPRYTFPAAHDNVDDLAAWILDHAEEEFGADPRLLTLGGASVGGNLALSAAQYISQRKGEEGGSVFDAKAFVGFYVPVDFRLRPEDKPKPTGFPRNDPSAFLFPLFDSYAQPARAENLENPRLNPIIVDKAVLPPDMFFVAAGIDILLHEQLRFVQRIKDELESEGNTGKRIEVLVEEKGFHGWLECKLLLFISLHLFTQLAN
jgi:acetyl esterase/lipase